jgi:serine O-acetyltransferase
MKDNPLFSKEQARRKIELMGVLTDNFNETAAAGRFQQARFIKMPEEDLKWCVDRGCLPVDALDVLLHNLLEASVAGHLSFSCKGLRCTSGKTSQMLSMVFDQLYATVLAYLNAAGGLRSKERKALALVTTFTIMENLPRLRARAEWNIFASLRDPAVWDRYACKLVSRADELSRVDLQPQIDLAIRKRDIGSFKDNLSGYGLSNAYGYLLELVRRSYPGWKILFFHDVAHLLAKDTVSDLLPGETSAAVPILPRVISEHVANLYQADVHPETVIGDANFIDHPHRGLTTGQTGSIGCGCVVYPCTLGGVTDKVKPRHPVVGDFIVLGTDCGLFGVVTVGDGSIIGANAKVMGNVVMEKKVRVGMGAVVGTVREGSHPPGEILLKRNASVGDGSLVENRHQTPLVISPDFDIPAHSHVVNDGTGRPKLART